MKLKHILCAALAALVLVSCADGKSPVEHGMDVVAMLDEMAGNTDYLSALTGKEEVLAIAAELDAGNYEQYRTVYRITIDEEKLRGFLGFTDVEMSDSLKNYFNNGALSSVITRLNAAHGVNYTMVSSLCTAGKKFVSRGITENCIYLYTFEKGTPIAVIFGRGEDDAVSASGYFILDEDFRPLSVPDVEALFSEFEPVVEAVAGN